MFTFEIFARLDAHDGRLDDYEQRLEQVEATLGDPGWHITPDQAMQISQAVKAIALALESERTAMNLEPYVASSIVNSVLPVISCYQSIDLTKL